ncbi:MAG: T9SS type A sorting domain-containing protein, partial [bacterium]
MVSKAIMADGLNGQRFCETTGLDPILPPERIVAHLHQVFERCVQPLTDYTGDGIGDMGAVNGRNADGSPLFLQQPDEVWTGSSYFIAAMMFHWGKIMNDELLKDRALKTAYGVYYQTWVNEETAYYFNTPEAWHYSNPKRFRAQQYQRPRSIWELLLEIKNPFDALTEVHNQPESDGQSIPNLFRLYQNYPNPFNATTIIQYELFEDSDVTLTVYDVEGRILSTLLKKKQPAGIHHVVWYSNNPSGIYFCKLKVQTIRGSFEKVLKMIIIK